MNTQDSSRCPAFPHVRLSATAAWRVALAIALLTFIPAILWAAAPHAAPAPASTGLFKWRPFLAPFHAVVLHYPIGFLTMAFLLELYRMRRPSPELSRITTWVILLSLISGCMAATLGWLRAANGNYEGRSLDLHRWYGIAIPFLTVLTLAFQMRQRGEAPGVVTQLAYRFTLVITLIALVLGGHYGGNLTHGSKYLVQNAPHFLKTLLDETDEAGGEVSAATTAAGAADPGTKLFLERIHPVFEAKCVRCHGPEKQKGRYRLDQRALALKAGESGEEAIKPKDPFKSNLVRLILLPSEHDEVMPPSGKDPLTQDEIIQIIRWIQLGAPYPAAEAQKRPGATASR
jgi:uncharacterized membrane protein